MKALDLVSVESLTNFRSNNCKSRAAYVIWKANGEQCPFCHLNLCNLRMFRIHCLGVHSKDYLPMEAYKLMYLLKKVKGGGESNPNKNILVNYKLNPKDGQFINDEYLDMVNVYERKMGISGKEKLNFTQEIYQEILSKGKFNKARTSIARDDFVKNFLSERKYLHLSENEGIEKSCLSSSNIGKRRSVISDHQINERKRSSSKLGSISNLKSFSNWRSLTSRKSSYLSESSSKQKSPKLSLNHDKQSSRSNSKEPRKRKRIQKSNSSTNRDRRKSRSRSVSATRRNNFTTRVEREPTKIIASDSSIINTERASFTPQIKTSNILYEEKRRDETKNWARRFIAKTWTKPSKTGYKTLDEVNSKLFLLATSYLKCANEANRLIIVKLSNERGPLMKNLSRMDSTKPKAQKPNDLLKNVPETKSKPNNSLFPIERFH